MSFTYAEWMSMTKRWGHRRSDALRAVDDAFEIYEDKPTQKHLETLSKTFKTWSNTKQKQETHGDMTVTVFDTIRNKKKNDDGKGPVELLREFIASQTLSNIVVREEVTGLIDRVAVVEISGSPFTQQERRKIQETISILADAVQHTRDVTIAALARAGKERNLYAKWFGAFDQQQCRNVRDRIRILDDICAKKGIIFNDGRDNATYRRAFAWAYPGNERNFPNMWLGDAFFRNIQGFGRGREAVSRTLGTFVHELTHACFRTHDIDLPQTSGGALCNDPKSDCRLAEVEPDDAFINADNYGEFVVDVFTKDEFIYVWP